MPFDPAELRTESGKSIEEAQNYKELLITPDGSAALGRIDKNIQDKNGVEFPAGDIQANAGAVQYIERRHGDEIRSAGYDDAQTFMLDVLNNYGQIYRGDGNAVILVAHGDAQHSVKSVITLEQDENGVYAVNDAGIVRNRYLKNKELLYTRSEPYIPSPQTGTAGPAGNSQSRGISSLNATPSSNSAQIITQNEIGVRGSIDLSDPSKAVISLYKTANASTFLHEIWHMGLDDLLRYGARDQVSAQVKADRKTAMDWLGITEADLDNQRRMIIAQEKWARAGEAYFKNGKAPTAALQGVFDRIKAWMIEIYDGIKQKYI